jgi:hypothetical protein
MNKTLLCTAIAVALFAPTSVTSAESAEITELKRMIQQMKKQHEQEIQKLEQRIQRTEKQTQAPKEKTATVAQTVQQKLPPGDNSFNPAISLVLQGGLATYSEDPEEYHLEGMPLGGESGLHDQGLAMWETELTASANVDNLFFSQATIGMHTHDGENEVDVEEAFIDTLSLPAGLGVRFGRFYSALGYLNEHHTHAWDFADAPLAYQAFLGKQYRDDGVRVTWIAPIDTVFLELGVETLRGQTYPGGGNNEDFGAARNLFAKVGGDVGLNNSWQAGVSHLSVDPEERSAGGHAHDHDHAGEGPTFDGDSTLTVFDAVWKTNLGGQRALIIQGEYLLRDEDGKVTLSEDAGDALIDYDGKQDGWYLQGIYQYNRQWRGGLRYDRLSADNDLTMVSNDTGEDEDEIFEESGYQSGDHDPHRWSVMVDWSPSEFSRLRLQYARDDSREDQDNQMFLQYIMTLGAHGAHRY